MRSLVKVTVSVLAIAAGAPVSGAERNAQATEDYIHAPMPPGFQVIATEIEGPVFADAAGRTLYKWPAQALRNGNAGEIPDTPTCDGRVYRENSGLMSPYPPGLELPEVETRPSCTDMWPPVLATAGAAAVGKWTVIDRPDGRKQWAYDGLALYTSVLDRQPGDVLGGSSMFHTPGTGAVRFPVGPDPNVPSQFTVTSTMLGRQVTLADGWSVYSFDGDRTNKSNCNNECLDTWSPVVAPAYARSAGEWTAFERSPGIKQWAFRGKPLYRFINDPKILSQDGSDMPGWHAVYTQHTPQPPSDFTLRENLIGVVLADSRGSVVYRYQCTDDAFDQLACDTPESPQIYRLAVCGGGDPDRCVKAFPYVLVSPGAKSTSRVWSTMYIDPKTGRRATEAQPGALHVWAFRDRPVYTFAGDTKPGQMNAQSWGEFNGARNGFKILAYRDLYGRLADSFLR